ncbi:AfsR/SARP family transcriptional regulator [Actinoplanes siamensis]|uniref:SARP family transcriptional regulator n=1 Tax=Actinoplanes siamensis TaxID=1223317 RepID=A0A919TP88_9ACTN|nr:BTAD domain-containing putative transcriptional regulator [Actinoplanes siamensis]GIF08933.1 SARP family transcriptional regulator [Actinoplanes siamensis]
MPSESVRFRILGSLEVWLGDVPVAVARPRHRAVLGYLLLNANRVVTVEALAEAMWGGAEPATARSQLQADVSAIRRAGHGRLPLLSQSGGYLLRAGPDELDHLRFGALTAGARDLAPAGRAIRLREALALWRGPALANASGAYVAGMRRRLDEERLAAWEDLFDAELQAGRHREIVPELAGMARDEPTRERLWIAFMLALHRCGRQADALAAGRELRRFLADGHGLEPGQAFVAAERAILRADAAPGERDVPRVVPALLPPDIADFTGRASEVARLDEVLARGGPPGPVVTITGMGGVGKSTLAVHAAHRAAHAYPDGRLYARLHGTEAHPAEPGDVLARFLRALGVDERAIPIDLTERADAYRSRTAGRRVLVVLDDAADEAQIRPLLPGDGACAALVTSRSGLDGLAGAERLQLGVFSDEEAVTLLGRVAAAHRVSGEPTESAAILRLVGRLPLAVRIVGARLRSRPAWPMSRLTRALRDEQGRLDHLVAGDLAVRTSIASSYHAIGEPGRSLARRLSLFAMPDFPSWLAAAVTGTPVAEAEELLERLVDAHLLLDAGTDATGGGRYHFHDLVLLYLRERAREEESGGGTEVVRAGLGAYLWLARRMSERIPGPCYAAVRGTAPETAVADLPGPPEPLAWFAAERVSLVAAVRQACDTGAVELAFDLAGCLEKYFDIRGVYIDWRSTNDYVLAACRAAGHRLGEAVMLRGLIELATWHEADHPGAAMERMLRDADRLFALFTEAGHGPGTADAAVDQAWALAAAGDYQRAAERAETAIRLAGQHAHLGGQARAHVARAVVHGESLEPAGAEHHLTVALRLARQLGNQRYVATTLQFIGMLHTRAGRRAEAITALDESLRILRRYQDRYAEVLTLLTLARAHLPDPAARGFASRALTIAREYNLPHHTADALGVLGTIELADGNHAGAVGHLAASVRLWRERGWPAFLAEALRKLGDAHSQADPDAARRAFREARDIHERLGHSTEVAELDALISDLDRIARR